MQKLPLPSGMRPIRCIARWLPLLLGLGAPLSAQVNYATPYAFQVLAGLAGNAGSTNGTGSAARFNRPYGMAVDSSGNVYVADRGNAVIRKITPAGVVTTIAGTAGVVGSVDGTGTAALFNDPSGLAVDSTGNVYVADTGNNTIRKITPAGVVSTPVGTPGTSGSADGTGPAATFSNPYGVAVDGSGNLYVTDTGNDTIRKITSGGTSSTFAGSAGGVGSADGTGATIQFNSPIGIAIDSGGNLYVADSGNNTIRKITSAGVSSTLAGNPGIAGITDATGVFALFDSPRGVAVDSAGNVYVADAENSAIRKVTAAGLVTTLAGDPGVFANAAGTGSAAEFDVPFGVAVNSSGTVYVSTELGYTIDQGTAATALAPSILLQPQSQTILSGSSVVFHVMANGLPAPAYQWYRNGSAISNGAGVSGATGTTLVVTGATAASAGSYTCTATNASGSATSGSAALAVISGAVESRIVNISCRSQVNLGPELLVLGFAVGGAGTSGSESLLVRASGPALGVFGVTGALPDPLLQFYSGPTLTAMDAGWAGNAQIASVAAYLSAFPWTTTPVGQDSALLETEGAGQYTAQVTGLSGDTGIALAEVYDATPPGTATASTPRLVNISARSEVVAGSGVMIVGFVIDGSAAKTVLIRASGPALSPFLSGTLADPELQLYSGSTLLATNFGWGGDPEIAAEAASVGAFAWTSPTSNDSAVLLTLAPGAYTAQVAGASGDTGIALLEVYEIQ